MVVVSKPSDSIHTEVKSETVPSANTAQDVQVEAIQSGRVLLKSKIQKTLESIHKWKDTNLSEVQRRAEKELSQLLTLVNELIHEAPESFLNRLDKYCSDATRKCPGKTELFFGRKTVFLKNISQWAQSTRHTLSETEEKYKSRVALQQGARRERDESTRLADEIKQLETLAQVKEGRQGYGMLTNIPRRHVQYETIPRPLYGRAEESVGEHFMVKINVKLEDGQEVVTFRANTRTKTVHSYSGASAESPPEVWVNQIRGYRDSPQLSCIAQLFGYNQCGQRYDLLFHGSLIPFEEQLQRLYDTQPLRRVELISKTTWELKSACSYFKDKLNFRGSKSMIYWYLMTMLHFNEEKDEMVICGDLSEWERDICGDLLSQSQDAVRRRLPNMFTTSIFAHESMDKRPKHPNYSKAQTFCGDLPIQEQQRLVLDFYRALAHTYDSIGSFDVPFLMRGIHVDPRIHKPCNRGWCRPMGDIWGDSVTCFIRTPRKTIWETYVRPYQPGSKDSWSLPNEFSTDPPRYLQVLTSPSPHFQCSPNDHSPVSLTRSSSVWFSQAGRVFSSPQFKKSGLKKSDITYVRTEDLHSAWMINPSELGEAIPDDLMLEVPSFAPHMDMNGIHVGPTKWTTKDPLHRAQICQSSWTIRKCFYCAAQGCCWDDAAYEALDDFHRSLGMDPSSGEMAEFLGFPLLDIDELLHKSGWTCSHPTIKDSVVKHVLSNKDLEGGWDPSICCPNAMVMDGTSQMNKKMRKHLDEGYQFSVKDLCYSPPTMYSRLIMGWIIIILKFLSTSILGWSM